MTETLSRTAEVSTPAEAILDAVRALAPGIARRAREIELARRLPVDIVDELAATGCLAMLLPPSHGGGSIDLPAAMDVLEELSRADGSVGWTAGICAGGWIDVSGLPRTSFDSLYAEGPAIVVGVFSPSGVAVRQGDGYRVDGRWAFSSGCEHARWLYGNCIEDSGAGPQIRTAVFDPDEVEIEDTWTVAGLCGTGSHHFSVHGVVVPAERTCLPLSDPPCLDAPLLRIPPPTALAPLIASVGLGIAAGALDDITVLAAGKVPLLAPGALASNALFQHQLGTADAMLRAARGLVYTDAEEVWATGFERAPFTPELRARTRATCTWATATAAAVVDSAYTAGGGTALYADNPLQRRFRDIHAVTQHFLVKPDSLTTAGAVLAGQDVDLTVF